MLRAALKRDAPDRIAGADDSPNTHNAACGIETTSITTSKAIGNCPNTHNAACGIETFLRLEEIVEHGCPNTHNAACGIETRRRLLTTDLSVVPTHIMPRAALKRHTGCSVVRGNKVPTHIMLRAALKPEERCIDHIAVVPTHTMLRAALKHRPSITCFTISRSQYTSCCVRL